MTQEAVCDGARPNQVGDLGSSWYVVKQRLAWIKMHERGTAVTTDAICLAVVVLPAPVVPITTKRPALRRRP